MERLKTKPWRCCFASSNMSLFETRIRHQNQKFLGFGQAGIRIGDGGNEHGRKESAEIIYEK